MRGGEDKIIEDDKTTERSKERNDWGKVNIKGTNNDNDDNITREGRNQIKA